MVGGGIVPCLCAGCHDAGFVGRTFLSAEGSRQTGMSAPRTLLAPMAYSFRQLLAHLLIDGQDLVPGRVVGELSAGADLIPRLLQPPEQQPPRLDVEDALAGEIHVDR